MLTYSEKEFALKLSFSYIGERNIYRKKSATNQHDDHFYHMDDPIQTIKVKKTQTSIVKISSDKQTLLYNLNTYL